MPAIIFTKVVFPAPDGPSSPKISARDTDRSMPSSTVLPPNDLPTPRTCTTVSFSVTGTTPNKIMEAAMRNALTT
jgi:hypothetical protein